MSNDLKSEDPRWIVEDLGNSGKNVNNWHWSFKDDFKFIKLKIKECFLNKVLYNSNDYTIQINNVKIENDGEVQIFNRKNKIMGSFDIDIVNFI